VQIRISDTADVGERVSIGTRTSIWHLAQVREDAVIGNDCNIGRGVYIGPSVKIGNNVKIQNHALIYDPSEIEDGAFIGPAAILTNDIYPRSVDMEGNVKGPEGWQASPVKVGKGASIGARAVVLAGTKIGAWALIGAGSVVIRSVPAFALVVGNPARQIGWVGRAGVKLTKESGVWVCPSSGEKYIENAGELTPTES
jgi:UDP-2-acetamido-3-amino-2,3-dideoxy-glucuronate N-acetyltransferase|tara:strand:+ start:93 stop:686 length:594 start_codon:yes stop_codon:yes gene_type:complete